MLGRQIALVVWLLGQSAAARTERSEPSRNWLDWSSSDPAAGCGDPSQFGSEVEKRLGRSPSAAAAELELSIIVRVERLPGPPPRWTGEIRVHTRDGAPDGIRMIERAGDACEPLNATLALMAALVLQPGEKDAGPGTASVEKPAPPNRIQMDEPGPEDATSAVERDNISRRWTISVAVGPALDLGLLPGPTVAGEVAVAVQRGRSWMLVASAKLSAKATAFINTSQGATLSRSAAEVAGCWPGLDRGSRMLALCGGAELGRLRAEGFGFDPSTTQERWSVGVIANAQFRQRLVGPLFAGVGAELLIPLERDRIAYTDPSGGMERIFTTRPLAGSGQLVLGVSFR